ncbi:hypothetical protein [Streptomyces sp. NPDC003401]
MENGKMLDDDFRAEVRAEIDELVARHELTLQRIHERKATEYRRTSAREGIARVRRATDRIHYSGMPADIVRGYQDAQRKREAAENA